MTKNGTTAMTVYSVYFERKNRIKGARAEEGVQSGGVWLMI